MGEHYVGIKPLIFGGWCNEAAKTHDWHYENSACSAYSRKWVDREFLRHCLELAKHGRCKAGKVAASYAMYAIVRATGGIWWDGSR